MGSLVQDPRRAELRRFFPGDSELAQRMRDLDWSASPLGPVEGWPHNLRIALGVCLTSRFPLHVWWGPSLTLFYNDAYVSFLGRSKHPSVLGRSGREAWKEIWDTIGPMIDRVFRTGEASWSEDMLMFFDRQLPREEVYITFSFSPVPGDDGAVDGLFCACTETTDKIIGNRRLETLRKLGVRTHQAQTVQQACLAAAEVLAESPHDLPFVVLFVADEHGTRLERAATVGIAEGALGLPGTISLAEPEWDVHWPFEAVVRQRLAKDGPDPGAIGHEVIAQPWNEPIRRTRIVPVHAAGHEGLAGVMVVGISPRRPLDGSYAAFLDLVAGHVATGISDARAHEAERRRAERVEEANRQALFAGERSARSEAEHASRMKDEFLARVSHELASPIFAIRMFLEMLSGSATATQRATVESLRQCIEAQSVLINDLLDTSRMLNGKLRVTPEALEPLLPVQGAVEALRSGAEKKRIELRLEAGETPLVQGDETRLRQVVSNLVSNAIKFTPEGGRIDVVVSEVDGGVNVAVRDNGRGFPPDFRPLLFAPFRQEQESTIRSAGGLGLGLAIARQLVELHGGRVRADSPGKDRGATFEVWLPGLYEEAEPSALLEVNTPGALDGVRVLLVDDDAFARSALASVLELRGASVEVAKGVSEALEALGQRRFDVLLSDIAMPGEDGYSLIRKVRGGASLDPALPAAALTAHMREEDRDRALNAGFHAHIPKSVQPISLIKAVLSLVREHSGRGGRTRVG